MSLGQVYVKTQAVFFDYDVLLSTDAFFRKIIQGKEFVDLTHSFSPTTPVWSGFGQATMSAACDTKTLRPFTIERDWCVLARRERNGRRRDRLPRRGSAA